METARRSTRREQSLAEAAAAGVIGAAAAVRGAVGGLLVRAARAGAEAAAASVIDAAASVGRAIGGLLRRAAGARRGATAAGTVDASSAIERATRVLLRRARVARSATRTAAPPFPVPRFRRDGALEAVCPGVRVQPGVDVGGAGVEIEGVATLVVARARDRGEITSDRSRMISSWPSSTNGLAR